MVSRKDPVPRVSVVMAVRNGERYVQEAIDSILAQTFTDFELIAVDDGSTDGTRRILQEAAADRRVTVVSQPYAGIAQSLNRGVALARGDYIARQDADDISRLDRLARQVTYLDQHPATAMVGSWVDVIDEQGLYLRSLELPVEHNDISSTLLTHNAFIHGSILLRRAVLDEVGGYRIELPLGEDYDFFLRIAERFTVANLPEKLYQHRWSASSITSRMPVLMQHYAGVARELARQRREEDKDILMIGSCDNTDQPLEEGCS